ncbi:MAG TPA: glycosyl transferase [Pseudoalteromonas sp.]|nr:glycosyl transferase [Pseudoalteromonas sp.]
MNFHIITNFTELGGAESALIRVINQHVDVKITLITLMSKTDEMVSKITHPCCQVVALEATTSISLLLSSFKLCSLIKSLKPQKIYSWMYHANAIAAMSCFFSFKKPKLIWGVRHSLDDYNGEKVSTKIAIQLGRMLKFVPNKVVHCSKKSQLQHEVFGYNSPNKSVYIPNGYSFNVLTPRTFMNDILIIGAAGRFHDAKDYFTLFVTAKLLKDKGLVFELRLCGRGMTSDNKELLDLIEIAGLGLSNVHLLGEVDDMTAFYNQVDIFILSSKTEGFPNVLAESAAQGCAVFSTDVGDAPYIINNSEHIVAVKDAKALSECIYAFTQKPHEEQIDIVALTTQHVRDNFAIENIAKRFLEL